MLYAPSPCPLRRHHYFHRAKPGGLQGSLTSLTYQQHLIRLIPPCSLKHFTYMTPGHHSPWSSSCLTGCSYSVCPCYLLISLTSKIEVPWAQAVALSSVFILMLGLLVISSGL